MKSPNVFFDVKFGNFQNTWESRGGAMNEGTNCPEKARQRERESLGVQEWDSVALTKVEANMGGGGGATGCMAQPVVLARGGAGEGGGAKGRMSAGPCMGAGQGWLRGGRQGGELL